MKGIFTRPLRTTGVSSGSAGAAQGSATDALLHQFAALPPFPQSTPERLISLHLTQRGVLLLPRSNNGTSTAEGGGHSRRSSNAHEADLSYLHTSGYARLDDVAHEKPLSTLSAPSTGTQAQAQGGALIEWGKRAKVCAVDAKEVTRLMQGRAEEDEGAETLAYGVVGVLRVFNNAYLMVITSRTHAGDFLHHSKPVYRVTSVLSIPLEPKAAREALQVEALRQAKAPPPRDESSDESSSDEEDESEQDDVLTPAALPKEDAQLGSNGSSGEGEGIQAGAASALAVGGAATLRPNRSGPWLLRSLAGRAASEGADQPGEAAAEAEVDVVDPPSPMSAALGASFAPAASTTSLVESDQKAELTADERYHLASMAELEDKVVKETARQYSRGEMCFAYDFDITTPLQRKEEAGSGKAQTKSQLPTGVPWEEPEATLPLWRRVDRRFWHNEHLAKDFVDARLHAFVLPLMQGFYQVASLPIEAGSPTPPATPVDASGEAMDAVSTAASSERQYAWLLIVSRRSKRRAGLRYQRRGISDEGNVANHVETEQILLVRTARAAHTLTFVQFRGSIPLFWKQNPYMLKPPPVLERSKTDNEHACKRHFDEQVQRYGKVTCVNLAEQAGKEGAITEAYKQAAEAYGEANESSVAYVAFDFHKECAGMKFENVARLLERMTDDGTLGEMDYFWRTTAAEEEGTLDARPKVLSRQKGAFRVSCLDCLDRTNVVQSAFARQILTAQLERLGVPVTGSRSVRDEAFDFAFNDAWANNGDMVSQIYAGTRALKGDFTRTGKRNLLGMMNDATASVYRMVQGAVTDFFKQTVMDFQYGQMSLAALERYNEDLAAQDPSEGHRLARVRASAIETCAALVLSEGEEKLGGWTLFSPIEANRVQSPKLEEKVVLLTSKAIYSCGWDFTAEKLVEFSKILLGDVVGIKKGLYIISPHEAYRPDNHWGLVLSYISEERRLNSASMRNVPPAALAAPGATNFIAFRAVVDDFVGTLARQEGGHSASSSSASTASASASVVQNNNAPAGRGFFTRKNGEKSSTAASTTTTAAAVEEETQEAEELTSHAIVDKIVALMLEECTAAGAVDEDDETFVVEEEIQSLAQVRANASLFAPLLEGLKRRLWL